MWPSCVRTSMNMSVSPGVGVTAKETFDTTDAATGSLNRSIDQSLNSIRINNSNEIDPGPTLASDTAPCERIPLLGTTRPLKP